MSVTYGFYDSKNGDRRYNAIQMSSIFDGIIRDGILQHIGTAMMVKESEGMIVNVGIGRAWFNHTWTLNDALLPLEIPTSEIILNRIDAIVLEVDARESMRKNSIKIIKGAPASSPKNPSMIKTNDRWQYPLAYVRVNAGITAIRQADIINCVGTSACPFVTAPLEKMSIDALISQWGDQWSAWFDEVKDQLSEDAAGNLLILISKHTNNNDIHVTSKDKKKWDEKMDVGGDSNNNTTTFTSHDTASPTGWTNVSVMTSEEKHSSLFEKVSTMFGNIRYLRKLLGITDISAIGGGTVTGAISSLNTVLSRKQNKLLYNTFVPTNRANANGVITLGIDISSLGLSKKPSAAFLQGQNAGLYSIINYVYAYDQSTATLAVFVVNYGSGAANQTITDRYGFVIFP